MGFTHLCCILIIYYFLAIVFLSLIITLAFLVLGKLLRKKSTLDREFQSPFECGFSTLNDHRLKFSLHFFLIALVFIIFDIELIILFPFFNKLNFLSSLGTLMLFIIFLFILTLGLLNEWNQLILEWTK